MSIAEQFSGLPMDQLIGAPLSAAADASVRLADSTANFINQVGFDKDGNIRTVAFGYTKKSPNEDGTSSEDSLQIDVPVLSIVPIPNLQVDEVNIQFDMEVKTSERTESALDSSFNMKSKLDLGIFKAEVSGSVSSHSSNTRSSDNSAKYHVDVKAGNHGTPEGLARVMDMLAANVAPRLIDTEIKDGDGRELSEDKKQKAEKTQALKKEADAAKLIRDNAEKTADKAYRDLRREGEILLNKYETKFRDKCDSIEKDNKSEEEKQNAKDAATKVIEQTRSSWHTFRDEMKNWIAIIADDAEKAKAAGDEVSESFKLKKYENPADGTKLEEVEASPFKKEDDSTFVDLQKRAVDAQKAFADAEKDASKKENAYRQSLTA